jgi:hypothetical protein
MPEHLAPALSTPLSNPTPLAEMLRLFEALMEWAEIDRDAFNAQFAQAPEVLRLSAFLMGHFLPAFVSTRKISQPGRRVRQDAFGGLPFLREEAEWLVTNVLRLRPKMGVVEACKRLKADKSPKCFSEYWETMKKHFHDAQKHYVLTGGDCTAP